MPQQTEEPARRVVLGVDGSECSTSALRWAMAYARLTGGTVEVITTWQMPDTYVYSYGLVPGVVDAGDIAASLRKNLDEVVASESVVVVPGVSE